MAAEEEARTVEAIDDIDKDSDLDLSFELGFWRRESFVLRRFKGREIEEREKFGERHCSNVTGDGMELME